MKQYEAVIETLDKLGGVATLGDLNSEVFKIQECEWKTKTPFASIRRIVQQTKGIYKIKPGLYGLEKYRKQNEERGIIPETEKNKDSEIQRSFNHAYYQGLLVIIGNLRNLKTFIPNQDKNKKFYDGKTLQELSTLKNFYVRMAIVADAKRKSEFETKLSYHAFDELRLNKRVSFLSYEALVKQYEMEIEKQSLDFIL